MENVRLGDKVILADIDEILGNEDWNEDVRDKLSSARKMNKVFLVTNVRKESISIDSKNDIGDDIELYPGEFTLVRKINEWKGKDRKWTE